MVVPSPCPKSLDIHSRAEKYMKGYSSQVQLFPVAFESGSGCTLTDVDGNTYIDFSSGIFSNIKLYSFNLAAARMANGYTFFTLYFVRVQASYCFLFL